jgi:phospholipid/cholesterol/gamma-HCH transport system permease protein
MVFAQIGRFFIFLGSLVSNREKPSVYWKLFIDEAVSVGISSIFIVSIVSSFIGAVTFVQSIAQKANPLVFDYIVSSVVREMIILELGPTITCVVLAGKVGSHIAGQLGTMRITEQIDALEVMGINSTSYLILPKLLAALVMFPLLVGLAIFLGMLGGYVAGVFANLISSEDYIYGLRYMFKPYNIVFALIKAFVFGFLVTTISAYKGYYTTGGALEVGQASTQAVTNSCIAILLADFILAKLLL